MEKNKLGIVINTTKANNRTSGFRPIYNYNSDEWSSVVRDTGAELKKVTNNANSDPIHLIQFVGNGCCYCIMQSISGRRDYQSAWIFIHKDIILPKGELSSVIKKIEEILSLDVEDKKAELDSLFAKIYPTSESPSYPPSSGDTYAVRYYGDGTNLMYNDSYILEDYLYQSDYCRYKSVFLINKAKGQTVTDATDLSDTKLQKCVVIELPGEIDGFKHNLGSNSIRVTEGTKLKIRWTRPGYAPIDKEGKAAEELKIQKSDYWKSFRLSLFRIIDKVTKKKLEAQITFISSKWFDNTTNPQVVFFKEEDLNRISFHVERATYHSLSDVIDLTKPNENGEFVIELQPEEHVYNCYISTDICDNRRIEFVIKTQYKLRGNEIPGFRFDGSPSEIGFNKLKAAPPQTAPQPAHAGNKPKRQDPIASETNDDRKRSREKKRIPWFKYSFIVLLSLALICVICVVIPKENTGEPQVESKSELEPPTTQTEQEKAFDYLNKNNTYWIKEELESYSELKGVFNLIKDYMFEDLKSFIDEHLYLKDLDTWDRLYEISKKYNNKKGVFTNDGKINIEEYLNTDFGSKEDLTQAAVTNNSDVGSSTSVQGGSEVKKKSTSPGHSHGTSTSNPSNSNNNSSNSQDNDN